MTVQPSETDSPQTGAQPNEQSSEQSSEMHTDTVLRSILCDVLGLEAEQVDEMDADSGLFGHLPELDSMAVASLLTEMEDRLDIVIDDEDVDGEMLETFGGLLGFAQSKTAQIETAQLKTAEAKTGQSEAAQAKAD
jgi:acyl carrier protein